MAGNIDHFQCPAVGMVGARNASAIGTRFARELAGGIGDEGRMVVSGLARWVDAAAHNGAMSSGTIAEIVGGLDVLYPKQHEALQGLTAVGIDEIIRQSGLPHSQVQLALLELDLAGWLERHAGGKVSLIPA